MAELAASIIGIASAGAKISLVLYQLASDIGAAGKEAKAMADEVSSFCAVLRILGDTLERVENSSFYLECSLGTRDVTDRCLNLFEEFLNAVDILQSEIVASASGKFNLAARIKWVCQKPKILQLRASIESYKSNFHLLIATLHLVHRVGSRRNSTNPRQSAIQDSQDRTVLESLTAMQRLSVKSLRVLEDGKMDTPDELEDGESESPECISSRMDSLSTLHGNTDSQEADIRAPLIASERLSLTDPLREEIRALRRSSTSLTNVNLAGKLLEDSVARPPTGSKRPSMVFSEQEKKISGCWSSLLLVDTIIPNQTLQPDPDAEYAGSEKMPKIRTADLSAQKTQETSSEKAPETALRYLSGPSNESRLIILEDLRTIRRWMNRMNPRDRSIVLSIFTSSIYPRMSEKPHSTRFGNAVEFQELLTPLEEPCPRLSANHLTVFSSLDGIVKRSRIAVERPGTAARLMGTILKYLSIPLTEENMSKYRLFTIDRVGASSALWRQLSDLELLWISQDTESPKRERLILHHSGRAPPIAVLQNAAEVALGQRCQSPVQNPKARAASDPLQDKIHLISPIDKDLSPLLTNATVEKIVQYFQKRFDLPTGTGMAMCQEQTWRYLQSTERPLKIQSKLLELRMSATFWIIYPYIPDSWKMTGLRSSTIHRTQVFVAPFRSTVQGYEHIDIGGFMKPEVTCCQCINTLVKTFGLPGSRREYSLHITSAKLSERIKEEKEILKLLKIFDLYSESPTLELRKEVMPQSLALSSIENVSMVPESSSPVSSPLPASPAALSDTSQGFASYVNSPTTPSSLFSVQIDGGVPHTSYELGSTLRTGMGQISKDSSTPTISVSEVSTQLRLSPHAHNLHRRSRSCPSSALPDDTENKSDNSAFPSLGEFLGTNTSSRRRPRSAIITPSHEV